MAKEKKAGDAPKTGGIHAPVTPSAELAAIVGSAKLPRSEVVSKVWDYIKKHNLQNPANKREILADSALEKVFGKKAVTMFEMNKHISAHVKA
ncbi:SWIB/MDM2 domain-containing protein [Sphingomonas sp.]|uniref:SWIB/MDM2 domain-containing protein n=1 Tax=Sphingomonas sp. TaxID=28214 RepID=UPI001D2062F5|nr:SWIB/MDM2 domain-containing protein [Sphingomonas sp.]MBX9796434.1 SWIB/MDM2 domain-containing protein [Sphingomonas sp.]